MSMDKGKGQRRMHFYFPLGAQWARFFVPDALPKKKKKRRAERRFDI